MTQAAANPIHEQLKVVRDRFLVLLAERHSKLQSLRKQLDEDDNNQDVLKQVQFIVHKIAGTAGTLGFPTLGELAANTETKILRCFSDGNTEQSIEETKETIDIFMKSAAEML
jgi:HPt (histidine-containing phosphotransfer) domain-containing protein